MRIVRTHHYGDVEGYELGFARVGKPFMHVAFYRLGSLLIDTGQSLMQREALALASKSPVSRVVLTHHHEDHSGNASAIQRATGASVLAPTLAVEKLRRGFRILPYQQLTWGVAEPVDAEPLPSVVEAEGVRLTPVPVPGHSKDLTAFHDAARGVLFSGDLYLGDRIKFFRQDEQMGPQIDSLRRALELDFDALLCAHRPVRMGGKARLRAKLQFLEDLVGQVAKLRARGHGLNAILRELPQKEVWGTRLFTCGNVSFRHMVSAALAAATTQGSRESQ